MDWNQKKRDVQDAVGTQFTAQPFAADGGDALVLYGQGGGGGARSSGGGNGEPVAIIQGGTLFVNDHASEDQKRELRRVTPNIVRALGGPGAGDHRAAGTRQYAGTDRDLDGDEATSAR